MAQTNKQKHLAPGSGKDLVSRNKMSDRAKCLTFSSAPVCIPVHIQVTYTTHTHVHPHIDTVCHKSEHRDAMWGEGHMQLNFLHLMMLGFNDIVLHSFLPWFTYTTWFCREYNNLNAICWSSVQIQCISSLATYTKFQFQKSLNDLDVDMWKGINTANWSWNAGSDVNSRAVILHWASARL